jgi:DNA-binding GntR family transcriptional regulator
LKPSSIRHRVVDLLRNAIIAQEMRPGQRLVEEEICERLGVSRGPVREALQQLEQEGLVLSRPFSWTEVAGISRLEVRAILMPIRMTLEQFGFAHAVKVMGGEDYDRLQTSVDKMREAARRGDVMAVNDLDVEFHEYILAAAGQPHCLQLWRMVLPRVRAYFFQWTRRDPTGLAEVAGQHQTLLDIMRRGNLRSISKALKVHIFDPDPTE